MLKKAILFLWKWYLTSKTCEAFLGIIKVKNLNALKSEITVGINTTFLSKRKFP